MLSSELEFSLNQVFQVAREQYFECVTTELLTLILLDNPNIQTALKACYVHLNKFRRKLKLFLEETIPLRAEFEESNEVFPTLAFQRVIQRAVFQVQATNKAEVTSGNVLIALFGEKECQAVFLLQEQGVTRLDIVNYINHGIKKAPPEGWDEKDDISAEEVPPFKAPPKFRASTSSSASLIPASSSKAESAGSSKKKKPVAASQYLINLNERVIAGKGTPLLGREEELERLIQILCRKQKSNALILGEPGVGKTALVEGLVRKIVDGSVPAVLANTTVYALDLGSVIAGTQYRGDFEQRIKSVLDYLAEQPDSILFLDEIHNVISTGTGSEGMDAAEFFKPVLANGELRCIGATTYRERRTFEKDAALARRFQNIELSEPSEAQTLVILRGLKSHFEQHHQVHYAEEVLEAIVSLSAKHLTGRFLPDKAIDVMDEVGVVQRLAAKRQRKQAITVEEVQQVIAKMARIPAKAVSNEDRISLQNLERDLKNIVFGQDHAIEVLVSTIKLARAGLREANKPWGCFLLTGPTGVGKTEITVQLGKLLGIPLLRFDMSEYMERHDVSRLIGAAPGYVGFEQGGLLTNSVMKQPHAIVLLDEIEKAHPDLFNVLLQVMDNGFLTDNSGRKVDFRNIILIMTSNAGAFETARNSMGFADQDQSSDGLEALKQVFTPEFRNRLDAVIQFKPLSPDNIRNVVDKFIAQLQGQLDEKRISLEVSPAAKAWLAQRGYDKKMGARPMARTIQEEVKRPLAEEILFGQLANGGSVYIDVVEEKLQFAYAPAVSETTQNKPQKITAV